MVWDAHKGGEFDHTAVAVLTKDDSGKLQVERHDTTAKHLAWVGAALAVVAPGVGVVAGAGAGALVGHFHHNIPKKDVEAIAELLESGQSGLIVVAVNKVGTDIEPLLAGAEKTKVVQTTWGDLDAEIDSEIAKAQTDSSSQRTAVVVGAGARDDHAHGQAATKGARAWLLCGPGWNGCWCGGCGSGCWRSSSSTAAWRWRGRRSCRSSRW